MRWLHCLVGVILSSVPLADGSYCLFLLGSFGGVIGGPQESPLFPWSFPNLCLMVPWDLFLGVSIWRYFHNSCSTLAFWAALLKPDPGEPYVGLSWHMTHNWLWIIRVSLVLKISDPNTGVIVGLCHHKEGLPWLLGKSSLAPGHVSIPNPGPDIGPLCLPLLTQPLEALQEVP